MNLLLAIVLLFGGLAVPVAADEETTLAAGRTMSQAFLERSLDEVWDRMTPQMREAFGTQDALSAFRDQLETNLGSEEEVLGEEAAPATEGMETYRRTSRWSNADGPILMQWTFDAATDVAGFFVTAAPVLAQSRFLDYKTRADLRLPFDGAWFVFWGGRTLEENYHAANPEQRFALDLLILRDGRSHAGDAADLSSYYCWGEPILAPAAGTVVSAVNDLPDNPIGQTDGTNPAGNHVVLDLGGGEFAFLAHMQQGSVAVATGDEVSSGDRLGLCGNSGNTSEPHLHIHLQTTPDLTAGEGLPVQFQDYVADGEPVERGEPKRGQTIALGVGE